MVPKLLCIAAGMGMMITLKEPKIRRELPQTTQAEPFNMVADTLLAAPLTQPDQQLPQLATKQTQQARQLGELGAKQKMMHGGQLTEHLTRLGRGPDMLPRRLLTARTGLKTELRMWVSTLAEQPLKLRGT